MRRFALHTQHEKADLTKEMKKKKKKIWKKKKKKKKQRGIYMRDLIPIISLPLKQTDVVGFDCEITRRWKRVGGILNAPIPLEIPNQRVFRVVERPRW